MGKLSAFNFTTLNGFFKGPREDTSWHRHGAEESKYASEAMKSKSTLVFGRVTYEMMASFWPTPAALQQMPEVARGMNAADKIVFSRRLKKARWENTRLSKDLLGEIKKLKKVRGKNLTILGSGTIVTQCAEAGLIDEYLFMIDPVVLGKGTPAFSGLKHKLDLKLTHTEIMKSGVVLLCYEPL